MSLNVKVNDFLTEFELMIGALDLMVSRFAAVRNKHADASINNVVGSKSLNVYFGIGVAWTMAAVYHEMHGNKFYVKAGK